MISSRLSLAGDLQFEVDGAGGTVRADGGLVQVEVADPVTSFRAVTGTYGGREGLSRLASGLAEAGVTVQVRGPRGVLATLGAGVDSRLGVVVAGTRRASGGPALLPGLMAMVDRRAIAGALAFLIGAAFLRRRPAAAPRATS